MAGFDLSYLVHSVPEQLVKTYLARVYKWQATIDNKLPQILFVRYYSDSLPQSYQDSINEFPENCLAIPDIPNQQCFILVADIKSFGPIYKYLSNHPCQSLYEQLSAELITNHQPIFRIRDEVWTTDKPRVMGVLNVTPDSFYDGGTYYDLSDYGEVAGKMIQEGADVIDIGGESSRPGAQPVSESEEIRRIQPALKQIRDRYHIPISVDTVKPQVADAMLEMGADMVNDISGLVAGKEMISVVKKHSASYCLMHILGEPQNMQKDPQYFDVVSEIYHFFQNKIRLCNEEGLNNEQILIDPGIGFGKTVSNNLDLLRFTSAFKNLNCLVMLGTSNKSFMQKTLRRGLDDRLPGTIATGSLGWMNDATVFRVHNVQASTDALKMARIYSQDV